MSSCHFGGMCWPTPDVKMYNLERRLRFGTGEITHDERRAVAAVLEAYRQMIFDPRRKRDRVIAEIRAEMTRRAQP